MGLAYSVIKKKQDQKHPGGKFRRMFKITMDPSIQVALKSDQECEMGELLKVPRLLPSQMKKGWTILSRQARNVVGEPAPWAGVDRQDLAWLQTLLHLQGGILPPPPSLNEFLFDCREAVDLWSAALDPRRLRENSELREHLGRGRNLAVTKRPWRGARGDAGWRERQATFYLRVFDYENARAFDAPEFTLLKVVCNLRNYFGMSLDQTVEHMTSLFNPRAKVPWSLEGIALAWELVEGITPSLALKDSVASADQKRLELEDEITELLAHTRKGGRVSTEDFIKQLKEWNPDLEVTKTAVSRAVKEITGIGTTSYREGRCYAGFHLPTPDELADPQHRAGWELDIIAMPSRPSEMEPLIPLDTLVDACPRAS